MRSITNKIYGEPAETIIEREGKLYIQANWENNWKIPEQFRVAYPTALLASEYPQLIGCKVHGSYGGIYHENTSGLWIALELGGETKPDARHTETKRINKPRGATRYCNGRWE
jgi:hypothetical protein